ncbi:MAG TPA: phosphotransferase [Pirellulales bacterium]|nr:phosphotransferase [Pirellulales bacterium]
MKLPNQTIAGGFSGSRIWQFSAQRGAVCLRRWPPEHPTATHLQWIHNVLAEAFKNGFPLAPCPVRTESGQTFVSFDGYLWQLEPWLPGVADDDLAAQKVAPAKLEAALAVLAQFHAAVAVDRSNFASESPAPGIAKRLIRLNELQSAALKRLTTAIATQPHAWPELAERAEPFVKLFCVTAPHTLESLRRAAQWQVRIVPCIRDIHRRHVLFEGNRVTGIVDFGAMQPDNIAGDVARLLGSFAGCEQALWEIGLAAYQRLQPLTESEQKLIPLYDESGVLLSGINWLQWVFVDGRQFENRPGLLARFDAILGRLVSLADRISPKNTVIV